MKKIILPLALLSAFRAYPQWTVIPSGSSNKYESAYFFDSNTGLLSSSGDVIKTTDGGSTWSPYGSVTGIRDIDFIGSTDGFAAGITSMAVKKTTNGGSSWSAITPPTSNSLWGVTVLSSTTFYVCGTGGVVWKSTNAGTSMSVVDVSTSSLMVDIDFINTTTGCVLEQTGKVWRTTNGGTSWTTTYTTTGVLFTDMFFLDASNGFAVGSAGRIIKTTDGGVSWTALTSGSTGYLQYVHFCDANNGIVAGMNGEVLRTTNGGTTWFSETTGTTENLYSCYMISPTKAIAAGDNGIIIMNNGLTLGTADMETPEENLAVYPNPGQGIFNLNLPEGQKQIQVTSLTGEVVLTENTTATQYTLNLSGVKEGMYLVSVISNGNRRMKKINICH